MLLAYFTLMLCVAYHTLILVSIFNVYMYTCIHTFIRESHPFARAHVVIYMLSYVNFILLAHTYTYTFTCQHLLSKTFSCAHLCMCDHV